MLERLKRLLQRVLPTNDDEPESFDHPRPQRVNPNPPQRDWFARVRERSFEARRASDAKALDAEDLCEPKLSTEAARMADDLFAKIRATTPKAPPPS